MQLPRNKAPDNAAMHPTAFASKSIMTSTKTWCGNIEKDAFGILHGLKNSTITALPARIA